MDSELDKKLCEKYPEIFRDRFGNAQTTAMCWGFEHGNGWYNIIDALCAVISGHLCYNRENLERHQRHLKEREMAAAGDWSFYDKKFINQKDWLSKNPDWVVRDKQRYLDPIPDSYKEPEEIEPVVAEQVKEKFGTLRFYYRGGDQVVDGAVRMAEAMSARTCEICGNNGRIRKGGWIRTLCDQHATEFNYNTNEDD